MISSSQSGSFTCRFKHGAFHPTVVMGGRTASAAYRSRDVLLVQPAPDDLWYVDVLMTIEPGWRLFLSLDGSYDQAPKQLRGSEGVAATVPVLKKHFVEIGRAPLCTPDPRLCLVAYRRR